MTDQEIIDYAVNTLAEHEDIIPDTMYHKNWTKMMRIPNVTFVRNVDTIFSSLYNRNSTFTIAEIGIGTGASTINVARILNNTGYYHIFDFQNTIDYQMKLLNILGYHNVTGHGCSSKLMDSYNWSLLQMIKENSGPVFDYIFLDGCHTFPTDGLAFFLADRLLKVGGYIEFDDYNWTLQWHLDTQGNEYAEGVDKNQYNGSFKERILQSFTEEQIKTRQVADIVDYLVKGSHKYKSIVETRVYQKISN